jgi:hypothetical protein
MVEDVLDEEEEDDDDDEGAGRDILMDDIEEWGWFGKPFASAKFCGSVGGVSIRSEAFL